VNRKRKAKAIFLAIFLYSFIIFTYIKWIISSGPGFSYWHIFPFVYVSSLSVFAYSMYRIDKGRAKSGESSRRIPESNLHLVEFMGGWFGAFIAQRLLFHKNKKLSFQIFFWLIYLSQQAFVYLLYY
jgi:uncharacterized membrane protein YsdA (DUF1294 family)